jgi:curved DNA-binding protein
MQGEDQHAKVIISLYDSYHGTRQTLTLNRPMVDEQGRIATRPHSLHVTIPKGVIEGQRIRLEGQGIPGVGNAPSGDLYLEIGFSKDPHFHAEQRDIHITLPITPWEAALGATVNVPTLGGTVQLKVPAGSQGGNKLRLKGRGLSTEKCRGDQIVHLRIVVPEAVSEEQKELYREMARKMPVKPRAEMEG